MNTYATPEETTKIRLKRRAEQLEKQHNKREPTVNTSEDVEIVKDYLKQNVEKAFPGVKAEVTYMKRDESIDRDAFFVVDVTGYNEKFDKSLRIYSSLKAGHKEVISQLPSDDPLIKFEKIFPTFNGAQARVIAGSLTRSSFGYLVSGSPARVTSEINFNDPDGWNKSLLRAGGIHMG